MTKIVKLISSFFAIILVVSVSYTAYSPVALSASMDVKMNKDAEAIAKNLTVSEVLPGNKYKMPSKDELKKKLTPLQYMVTQEEGTERPFDNLYWDNKREGIYVDIVSGEALFSSTDKYKSGTGWPSFTKPISTKTLVEKQDRVLFYVRTELRSNLADSHLGHVFDDGPAPTGKRYCINSASLRFVPKADLKMGGYGEYASLFSDL